MSEQTEQHIRINGKHYPLWEKFVFGKARFIGGAIEDLDAEGMGDTGAKSTITDIALEPNGTSSAMFSIKTAGGWSASCDVGYLAIGTQNDPGWLHFHGYGGWHIRIRQPDNTQSFSV
jgi:hypothetical protein